MIVLLAAMLLRLAIAPFTGHPYDLGIWMVTGRYVATTLGSPYDLNPSIGYPPLWALWCAIAFLASNALLVNNDFLYILIIKIPIIIADILVAYFLVRTGHSTSSERIGIRSAETFLLNPYVLAVGVIWGMMDNLLGLLLVFCAISITKGKMWFAGISLALAVALKFYPAVLLPVCLAYMLRAKRLSWSEKTTRLLCFLNAFGGTFLISIVFPFLIFGWNKAGFLSLAYSQVGRAPGGGIAPMSVINYLLDLGVTNIGPISIIGLFLTAPLRLIWVSAVLFALLFILINKPLDSFSILLREFALTYSTYLLAAPWASEQMLEPLLILMLFIGVSESFRKSDFSYYVLGSSVIFVFLTLHVPITSLLFPVAEIDPRPITSWGTVLLPLIVLVFGLYLAILEVRSAKQLNRMLTRV